MLKEKKYDKNKIIEKIYNYFEDNNQIVAVYIFGSLIRGNFDNNSDVDLGLMLKYKDKIEIFEYKLYAPFSSSIALVIRASNPFAFLKTSIFGLS